MDCTGQITIEDVRIPAGDGVLLAGTRCHPRAARAVALLLPGSGPQDRDQTVAGQPTFRHLAAGLADRGIGTLRCDDRGVGASGGDYLLLDGATLLADARAQVRWLRDRAADVPVAVIGHSQGGLFALRLAGVEPVCSTVLLGAAIRPGFESLMAMRARLADQAGASGPTRDAYLEHSKVLFTALVSIADESARRREVDRLVRESVADATDEDLQPDFASVDEYVRFAVEDAMEWEVRELLRSDPARDLAACGMPVLGLWGSLDGHVDPLAECAAFRAAAASGSRGEVLEGLNHLFQRSATGGIQTYATDGEAMQDPVVDAIADWIRLAIQRAPSGR